MDKTTAQITDEPARSALSATADFDSLLSSSDIQIQPWQHGEFLICTSDGKHLIAGRETAAVIRALCMNDDYSRAHIDYLAAGGRLPFQEFVAHATHCAAHLALKRDSAKPAMRLLWRRSLLSADRVAPAAIIASFLFRAPLALPVLALAFAAPALAFVFGEVFATTWLTLGQSLAAFMLILIGAVIHEFGHAGALVRHGQRAGTIGVGLYLGFFPVFYADVSRAWRLPIAFRIVVNMGGIYLQSAYAGLLMILGWAYAIPSLTMAGAGSIFLAVMQIIPFVRTDGYWVLSDLLCEPRLGKFEANLLRDWKAPGPRGRAARRRLLYLAGNLAVIALAALLSSRHAIDLLHDIAGSYRTGIVSDTLRQPSRWLSLVIIGFLIYRAADAARTFAIGARLRRRLGNALH